MRDSLEMMLVLVRGTWIAVVTVALLPRVIEASQGQPNPDIVPTTFLLMGGVLFTHTCLSPLFQENRGRDAGLARRKQGGLSKLRAARPFFHGHKPRE